MTESTKYIPNQPEGTGFQDLKVIGDSRAELRGQLREFQFKELGNGSFKGGWLRYR